MNNDIDAGVESALDGFELRDFRKDYRLRSLCEMIPRDPSWSVLDIGSGNGVIGQFLGEKLGDLTLSDYSPRIVTKLLEEFDEFSNITAIQIDAQNFQLEKTFDLITAMDVIEHLEDDEQCMQHCYNHLREGGTMFISVPAFPFLYGKRDEKYGHVCRYEKKELKTKLENAGFSILVLKYWNSVGVFPYYISEKLLHKELKGPARTPKSKKEKWVNQILYRVLRAEGRIPFLPWGLSLIAIVRK
jgi:SAM-dependent methyltransferase